MSDVTVSGRRRVGTFVLGAIAGQPLILAGLALVVLFTVLEPRFASGSNLTNIAIQASVLLITGTGMTFVILTAGIDLSVGALLFLGAAVLSSEPVLQGSPAVAISTVAAVCLGLGALNGAAVACLRVPAMIVTLASLQMFRGLAGHVTKQQSIIVPDAFRLAGRGDVFGIPTPIIIAIIAVAIGWILLNWTVFGRYVQAVGSRESAAVNAGLPVRTVIIAVYALAGLLAGVAAVVQVGRLGSVQPTLGNGFELTVITAVVLGGTSLTGGRGSVLGTALGAIVLSIVENGLVLGGASPYVFDIVRGSVLLVALLASDLPLLLIRKVNDLRRRPTVVSPHTGE